MASFSDNPPGLGRHPRAWVYNPGMSPLGFSELTIICGLCCGLVILPLAIALLYNRREKRK
ncbi:MAG: hypothetical protein ABIJ39_09835 [Chloroflexota bacterium]